MNDSRSTSSRRTVEMGQATIMFAVLASTLMAVMGLAVVGGQVFTEFRRMQAAVDMAALVGAQDLPCSGASCSTPSNRAYWCAFANYYGPGQTPGNSSVDCTTSTSQSAVSGAVSVSVSVPPVSCSPYDSVDYGNNSSDASCKQSAISGSSDDFIEVQMRQAFQVPIFNIAFNLFAHAIARHGEPTPKDFAMTMLDQSGNDISLSGNVNHGLVIVGSVMADSTANAASNGAITTGGQANEVSCDGGWYTQANESFPGNLETGTNGSPQFSPPDCNFNGGSADNPVVWRPNWTYIADPYCSSSAPPITIPSGNITTYITDCRDNSTTSVGGMSNCAPCTTWGEAYKWSTGNRNGGTWYSGQNSIQISGGDNWEFFPGIYSGIHDSSNSNSQTEVYFNPGVYTMTGDLKMVAQTSICIYGAPACQVGNALKQNTLPSGPSDFTCSTSQWGTSNVNSSYVVNSSDWFYYCSPWGIWDANPCLGYTGGSTCNTASHIPCTSIGTATCPRPVQLAAPTFNDGSTPLDGVTFYLVNDANFDMEGSGWMQLAFPNPCPGTGTITNGDEVPFFDPSNPGQNVGAPYGSYGYSYPSSSLAGSDGVTTSENVGPVYPSPDLSLQGECNSTNAGGEWNDEFGQSAAGTDIPQHLHFLIFARDGASQIKIAGSANQNVWGILYNPGDPTLTKNASGAGFASGCATPTKCTITLTGGGGSVGGPPMMVGQVIGDNFSYSGSVLSELFYRPCNPKNICLSGAGSGLVQ